jgi:single-stranded DNA-specific DHH superfamily exonuclease
MEAVFDVIKNFSVQERKCYENIIALKNTEKSIHYVCMNEKQSSEFFSRYGKELLVNISRAVADTLAEDCGKLGLVVYYDDPGVSGFVQFRLRRSAKFIKTDLREVLAGLKIENGGGHPGAVGFRLAKNEVEDIARYTSELVSRVEELVGEKP